MTEPGAKRIAAVGLSLQLALVIGIGAALAGMMSTFAGIGEAKDRAEAAAAITGGVAQALRATKIAVPVALAGLVLVAVALREGRGRERWIFRTTCCALCLWLLVFPVGTIIGIVGFCLLIPRRKEFRNGGE